jgi:transposase
MNREQRIERNQKLTEAYLAGASYQELGDRYDLCLSTVANSIHKCGVKPHRHKTLSAAEKKRAVKMYMTAKYTLTEIAERLDVSYSNIWTVLQAAGCDTSPRLRYNTDAFEDMTTEEAGYFFGLLLSDGCIYKNVRKNKCKLTISLVKKDMQILIPLKKYLGVEKQNFDLIKKKTAESQNSYGVSCHNSIIIDRLISYGLVCRKTWRLVYPSHVITPQNFKYILRGYHCGNGTFYLGHRSKTRLVHTWFLASTRPFLEGVRQQLNKVFPHHKYNISKNGGGHLLQLNRRASLVELIQWLYEGDPVLCIKRKKKKAYAILRAIERHQKRKALKCEKRTQ